MSTISRFKSTEKKHDVYRGIDCMKKFCGSLRTHALEIINFKKKNSEAINKRAAELISKLKNLLYIVKPRTFVIIQKNIEVLHIVYVIKV